MFQNFENFTTQLQKFNYRQIKKEEKQFQPDNQDNKEQQITQLFL